MFSSQHQLLYMWQNRKFCKILSFNKFRNDNVISHEEDEKSTNFIDSISEPEYSVLRIKEVPYLDSSANSLEIINAATGKTMLRATVRAKKTLFSATIGTGSSEYIINKKTADMQLLKDPEKKIL